MILDKVYIIRKTVLQFELVKSHQEHFPVYPDISHL